MNDNLPELRDIHLPDGVSIWPPAYGWFVILGSILALICLYKLYKYWRRKSRKVYALRLLSELDTTQVIPSAIAVSELLRRICVYRYPDAVSLDGDKWLAFLQQKTKAKLNKNNAELLLNAPYINPQKNEYTTEQLNELILFAKSWVGENL